MHSDWDTPYILRLLKYARISNEFIPVQTSILRLKPVFRLKLNLSREVSCDVTMKVALNVIRSIINLALDVSSETTNEQLLRACNAKAHLGHWPWRSCYGGCSDIFEICYNYHL